MRQLLSALALVALAACSQSGLPVVTPTVTPEPTTTVVTPTVSPEPTTTASPKGLPCFYDCAVIAKWVQCQRCHAKP